MVTVKANIKDTLAAKGVKATKHRLAVARLLAAADKPLGVKEIYERLVHEDTNVGMATVYRVMTVLENAGVVCRQPTVAGTSAHYQVASRGPGQVVCSRCGKVEDIDQLPEFERLRQMVSERSNFATTDQSLYIIADCRNEECD